MPGVRADARPRGIMLVKYWFSVSDTEQERRFQARLDDPTKRWKLSPMDLESRDRWEEYSRAKDAMFAATDIAQAPWWVVDAEEEARPPQLITPPARPGARTRTSPRSRRAPAPARGRGRLRPAAEGDPEVHPRRRPLRAAGHLIRRG